MQTWTALSAAQAIRSKQISPLELLDQCLARVDEVNGTVNAVIWRNDEEARSEARKATDRIAKPSAEELPPFFGVPIPIKDLTQVAGWPTTYGSWAAPDEPTKRTELIVDALRRAGFVLCGRTNTPEFGPITVAENVRYGATHNPWNTGHTSGGSSGGAAAAVAAGMFPAAHANDGGGSIRIPASCCGLVGLKASRGRVPSLVTHWEGGAVEGFEVRTVADAAAMLDVVSAPDPLCWYNAPVPERPFSAEVGADPGRLRIAVVDSAPLGFSVDPECAAAVRATADRLADLGHEICDETIEVPDEALNAFLNIVNSGLADYPDVDWDRSEPHIQANRALAQAIDSLTYVESVHQLQLFSREVVARWGRDFDVLLTPTLSILPPPVGVLEEVHASAGAPAMTVFQMAIFNAFFNVTGQPSVSLPLVMSESGLPIGLQFVAGPWREDLLFRLSAQLEAAMPWADRQPPPMN